MSLSNAEKLEENEQYDKAYEEYKNIYSQRPKDTDLLQRLGHLALILEKKDDAKEYYAKILELDSTNVMAYEKLMDLYENDDRYKYYIFRGNMHVVQEEISHAISDFKKALDKTQEEDELSATRFILATLYIQVGKYNNAIDELLRIIDTSAANEFVYLKLAEVYVLEDAITSAISVLERARENGFNTETIKETLAQLYLKNEEPESAKGLTQNDMVKIKCLLEENKNSEAFALLESIKETNKTNPQYHLLLAQFYFNNKEFEKSLTSVIEYDKFQKNSPLTYQMRALIYEEMGNEFASHLNWAKYSLSKQEKDVALNEYLLAYQIQEDDATLIRNLAELLEDMNDKYHAAEYWEKLAELEPNNKKALEKLADFKESIGDIRAEIEILEKLHKADSRSALIIKKLAKAYEKIKNKKKALDFYKKFVSISTINDENEQIKAKIAKLENSDFGEEEGLIDKIMRWIGNR